MISGRTLGRVYPSALERDLGMDDFTRANATGVLSVNLKHHTVEMRNGDRIYFVMMRHERDTINVSGIAFEGVAVHPEINDQCREYLRGRIRGPEADSDLTEMEV